MDWTVDPSVLWTEDINDFYPPTHWNGNETKLNNSIARLIIILTILYSASKNSIIPLLIGVVSLLFIFISKTKRTLQVSTTQPLQCSSNTFKSLPSTSPIMYGNPSGDRSAFLKAVYGECGPRRHFDHSEDVCFTCKKTDQACTCDKISGFLKPYSFHA